MMITGMLLSSSIRSRTYDRHSKINKFIKGKKSSKLIFRNSIPEKALVSFFAGSLESAN